MNTTSDSASTQGYVSPPRKMVLIPLDELKRYRDELMKMRDAHPRLKQLFSQLAGWYQRLEKEAQ